MFWSGLALGALAILYGFFIMDFSSGDGVISIPIATVEAASVEPLPLVSVVEIPKPLLTPISDRRVPDSKSAPEIEPTPNPIRILNQVNKDELLWLAADTSWRPYLWPNDYKIFEEMWIIASCESGNENGWIKVNRIGDLDIDDGPSVGVMQINIFYWPMLGEVFNLFDPRDNLQAAWEIWNIHGWSAWACSSELKK
jgi:hypothetical protein